jgi:hypothetical protein
MGPLSPVLIPLLCEPQTEFSRLGPWLGSDPPKSYDSNVIDIASMIKLGGDTTEPRRLE